MKRRILYFLAITIILQLTTANLALSKVELKPDVDVQVYLKDGKVIAGKLIEKTPDLVIVRIKKEVKVYEIPDVEKVISINSPEAQTKELTVWRFPRIGFLAATLAGSVVAAYEFKSAADADDQADRNERANIISPETKRLRDQAKRDRIIANTATGIAVVSGIVALIPQKAQKKVFAEVNNGSVKLLYSWKF